MTIPRHAPAVAPLEFGGRVNSRLVDTLLVAFGLFGVVLAVDGLRRGIRYADDLALVLLGAAIGVLAWLFWRHIRRAHIILHGDRIVIRKLVRSYVIPLDQIAEIAVYTRYNRQFLYRPANPHPEYMRSDILLLRSRQRRVFCCRLPYSPSRQPVVEALAERTGLEWEQLQGISAWKHRPAPPAR